MKSRGIAEATLWTAFLLVGFAGPKELFVILVPTWFGLLAIRLGPVLRAAIRGIPAGIARTRAQYRTVGGVGTALLIGVILIQWEEPLSVQMRGVLGILGVSLVVFALACGTLALVPTSVSTAPDGRG